VPSSRKLVPILWTVIAVLVIGGAVMAYLFVNKVNDLESSNSDLTNDVSDLRNQLQLAQASPSPSPTPSATPTPSPQATPTPSKSPAAPRTPTPTAIPKR
jgi:hypothetical protein